VPRPLLVLMLCASLSTAGCGSTVQARSTFAGGTSSDGSSLAGSDAGGVSATGGASAGTTTGTASTAMPSSQLPGVASGPSLSNSSGIGGQPGQGSSGPSSIAPTGPGWDQKVVHIGVTTTSDISTVGNSLGVHSINPGDLKADAEAMVAYLNARGGLFGRRIVPEFFDVRTADQPDSIAAEICAHFTQDVRVIGLLNLTTNGDTPAFDACIAKAHLPTFAWFTDTGDNSYFQALHGFYNNLPFPSWSRFARPFIRRLVAQGYFTPWDTTAGGPGTAPIKIGILEGDDPRGRQIAALLTRELTAVGHKPADVIFVNSQNDLSSSELKFRADGITHVMGTELLFLFMQSYESQHYRPRYGINSSNAPSLFLEGTTPAAQLVGSMGVGTTPTIDVFAPRDPGAAGVPGMRICNAIYQQAHVTYPPNQRYAYTNAYGMCDGMRLIVAAAEAGNGLAGDVIRDGLGAVGRKVPTSLTFSNGLSPLDRGLPGAGRDLRYFTDCQCYRYTTGTYPL